MRKSVFALALIFGLLHASEGRAQDSGEVRIEEEDDFFNPFTQRTDRYYTQGLRIEWLRSAEKSGDHFLPAISHSDWCSLICGKEAADGRVQTGWAIGQNIYTPSTITIARAQPYDHPWAGMLYGSRIARVSYAAPKLRAQRQDRIELTVGIVGPASLAREAQTEWHRLIRVELPRGWDHQLRNEPVVQLRYGTALRWPQEEGGNADVIARGRLNLGNALTSAEAEVTGRIGWNLSGFGAQTIPFAAPMASTGAGPANALSGTRWLASGNLFFRLGGRAVARNIFLDGNTFIDNDIRIDRKPLVPEIASGTEVNLVGRFWLTLSFVRRGSEFRSWRGVSAPAQEFGGITLAWHGN
ncbi:lipid A deacylase LpxR family protein [Sphingomonas soli]|uniref:lipid A deacylase LpxR family protein n=1 Tax=Sphingomonas soli TaxID=266127 RepID=UPI00082C398C|nr:lipid A deacylase LpxR family protein [Sphingomonas soli]